MVNQLYMIRYIFQASALKDAKELFDNGRYKTLQEVYEAKKRTMQEALADIAEPKLDMKEIIHCVQ